MNKETEPSNTSKYVFLRLGLMVILIIGTLALVRFTPVGTWLSLDNMKYMVHQTGYWGYLIFVGLYVVSAIMNIPGTAFLLLGILLFDYLPGATLSYFGSLAGAIVTFYIGRTVGGQALSEIKNKTVRRLLAEAEFKPIRTLVILRILVQFSPLVGYTLALTRIKAKDYLVGNLIGILIPTIGLTIGMYLFEDWIWALFAE